ncbi:MAG: bifunctional folylpolyglutamate synthase/dihydrofolate synthase [Thermoleophilia bacterium]|nr:bifunctional folylpolyglutamate synthase/dihydrofolate synthase [Thermoleophilia bacterium]
MSRVSRRKQPVPTVEEAQAYITGLEMLGTRLGLDRVRALAHELGDPQLAYRTVHVVGTNGKSSTTRFIASILRAHGLKVGAYVSPHLVSLAERQLVDGVPTSDHEFYQLVARIMPVAAALEAGFPEGERLTQFEVLTAAAFLHFKEKRCDATVIEAGLGGRWDATSIIRSDVQVVTTIGLEHTELLGETALAILEEKAAVIPPGGTVMAGSLDEPVRARLVDICTERAAGLRLFGEDVSLLADPSQETFDVFGADDFYANLRLSVLGSYQRTNAAVSIGAAELFTGGALDHAALRSALLETRVPGRLEVISAQPLCILDGAHNPSGMAEMVRSLDRILERRRVIGVVSILRDKGAVEMLRDLAPRCDILFVTENSNPRSYAAEELAALLEDIEKGPEVFIDRDARSALMSAYKLANSNQVILVTGSLYLISDLKRLLSGV